MTRGGGSGGVDVGVAGAGGGAVERRLEQREGAVEVDNGVGACDVERERVVQVDPFVDLVCGDARAGHEGSGLDHEALGSRVDGLDWVGGVYRVEHQSS